MQRAWAACRRAGLPVESLTTVHPLNYRQVDDVVRAGRGKVGQVAFQRHLPHDGQLGVLSSAQWMEVLRRVFFTSYDDAEACDDFVLVKDVDWQHLFLSGGYRCGLLRPHLDVLTFECNGDVYACRRWASSSETSSAPGWARSSRGIPSAIGSGR